MNTGMVVDVQRMDGSAVSALSGVAEGQDLAQRYETLSVLVVRIGGWLSSPAAQLLPAEEWETQFRQYQEHLERLRRLGDELRPVTLRSRYEPLTGEALVDEVMELFAA